MTDELDITEVLRTCAAQRNHVGYVKVAGDLLANAADEIERLRAQVAGWRDSGSLLVLELEQLVAELTAPSPLDETRKGSVKKAPMKKPSAIWTYR